MKQFMYLLRGGDEEVSKYSPEQMEAYMGEWNSWMGGLAQAGKLAGGLPLSREGKQLASKSAIATDGPFAEGKEVVGGYVIVKAENMDEAIEISRGCPIFVGETASLEIRELLDT